MLALRRKISSILLWSVISAAFIGPGTLVASSRAGALFKYDLIWALLFATIACITLQEMAARISIKTGLSLSKLIKTSFSMAHAYLIGLAVVLGCAAYEAGNILGALSGVAVLWGTERLLILSIIGVGAFILLWFGGKSAITNFLGILVALMGLVFIIVAFKSESSLSGILMGAAPSIPAGSEWLTLALIGTTIVPYNIYLGSGLSEGQTISEMRYGLAISIAFGGLISIAILVEGTQINTMNSFLDMAVVLGDSLGSWAYSLLGIGLFAAGFTSSVTAPMAAGVITEGLFGRSQKASTWYRFGWLFVLITGMLFGVLNIKPIPVIVAAQALNGFILPLLGVLLILKANDKQIMGAEVNSLFLNIVSFIVLEILVLLGLNSLWNVLDQFTVFLSEEGIWKFIYLQSMALIVLIYTAGKVIKNRK